MSNKIISPLTYTTKFTWNVTFLLWLLWSEMLYPGEPVIITNLLKNVNDLGPYRKALMKYTYSFCSLFPMINYSKSKKYYNHSHRSYPSRKQNTLQKLFSIKAFQSFKQYKWNRDICERQIRRRAIQKWECCVIIPAEHESRSEKMV